jgi:hypothetical protein
MLDKTYGDLLKMKTIIITIIFVLAYIHSVIAFEIDGFKSGMSVQEAKKMLENYSFERMEVKDDFILASNVSGQGSNRLIALGFCEEKLIQFQKHLNPRFDYFTRLVEEKRKEFGKPIDAFSRPTDFTTNIKSDSIEFIWKRENLFVSVSYTEFDTNNQLDLKYEIYNKCWEIPY